MHCSHSNFEIYKYCFVIYLFIYFFSFFFIVILVLFAGSICVILLDRNFSITTHVNHGKSTLADKLLELTGTIKRGHGQPQYLDKLQVYQHF